MRKIRWKLIQILLFDGFFFLFFYFLIKKASNDQWNINKCHSAVNLKSDQQDLSRQIYLHARPYHAPTVIANAMIRRISVQDENRNELKKKLGKEATLLSLFFYSETSKAKPIVMREKKLARWRIDERVDATFVCASWQKTWGTRERVQKSTHARQERRRWRRKENEVFARQMRARHDSRVYEWVRRAIATNRESLSRVTVI